MEDTIHQPAQHLNILILGASYAGLSATHQLLTNLIPDLSESGAFHYKVYLISPSTHLYWNICAPRAILSSALLPPSDAFHELAPGLRAYPPTSFQFILGTATELDTHACTATIACSTTPSTIPSTHHRTHTEFIILPYHAIILATGSSAHSPLLSLHGPHASTLAALADFHARLPTAETILIAGAGCTGVEVAGQLAHFCNSPAGFSTPAALAPARPTSLWTVMTRGKPPPNPNAKRIVLVTSSPRLLPHLSDAASARALTQLQSLGVRVITGVAVSRATVHVATGKTTLHLANGTTLAGDLYIPCTGVTPNSRFLGPPGSALVRADGSVHTVGGPAASTLRVAVPPELRPSPGPEEHTHLAAARVYAIGDVADCSGRRVLEISAQMPVLLQNLRNDLRAYQLQVENPYGGNADAIAELRNNDAVYERDGRLNQLVPIGWKKPGGVGIIKGRMIPPAMVWWLKGKEFKVADAKKVVEQGL